VVKKLDGAEALEEHKTARLAEKSGSAARRLGGSMAPWLRG
jgi:hypothetical protein